MLTVCYKWRYGIISLPRVSVVMDHYDSLFANVKVSLQVPKVVAGVESNWYSKSRTLQFPVTQVTCHIVMCTVIVRNVYSTACLCVRRSTRSLCLGIPFGAAHCERRLTMLLSLKFIL